MEQDRSAALLLASVRLLLDDLEGSVRVRDRPQLAESWTTLILEGLADVAAGIIGPDPHGSLRGTGAERIVRHAEEVMQTDFADISSAADIAAACGVSVRTLELAFRKTLDTSPMKALSRLRLHEARRLLLAADGPPSVLAVSLACGFRHQGRFAGAYRAVFDEAPGATLRRR